MKAKSEEIKQLLDDDSFVDLMPLQQKIRDLKLPVEHNEYTLNEAVVDFSNVRDLLLESIDNGVLDDYDINSRETIQSHLTSIKSNIDNIYRKGQREVPSLLNKIQNLKKYVFLSMNLDLRVSGLVDYKAKISELNELQQKYNSLLNEIEDAAKTNKEIHSQVEIIKENLSQSNDLINQQKKLDEQFAVRNRNTSKITSELESRHNRTESMVDTISEFHESINNYKESLDDHENKTQELIENNKELESKITDLLSSAVGGALGKTFGERKSELKDSEIFWKNATFVAILILFGAAGALYFEILSGVDETATIISKISLLIPASAAVWFTASNYNRERKLLEEYAFKSSLSLSLDSYRKVLNEELDGDERVKIAEFLINSMEKIYSSPLENISKHSPKDEIEISLFEKMMNSIGKNWK
ncbi:coiled-coil domain-containing protein [Methanohalophilus portucalensis]|uniref:Uncharacterized protein n=2 Tax=Methanohalophilus portucalensis TaxID=39664 RepID=A0A1L9C6Q4_9EURY|nr:hypothetical protein [Methanohalophilus portucalensis]ATU08789.1 hypothetical protein BKM01_08405 [Methanohalophilus portucalensis]OJH50193.1 hypothetical protein MPF_0988 [Methanohalophilus portucalensis FDF-1]RNI13033.1 hypothetical protein EFE41_00100 [Methanohalophilus portucalensis FDF-1]SMH30764.1 hypothetical protein SAMN06264941_0364 [Methanohalophilus portucalensis FDF-1]